MQCNEFPGLLTLHQGDNIGNGPIQVNGAKIEYIPDTKYPVSNIESAHVQEHHRRHERLHPSSQTQQNTGHHTESLTSGHPPYSCMSLTLNRTVKINIPFPGAVPRDATKALAVTHGF
jgi:hypothetical protein